MSVQANDDALHFEKDIGLTELDGFQLPPEVTEEFLTRMQEQVDILGAVDTMTLDRLEQNVPQFGVPRLSGGQRNEGGSRTKSSSVTSGQFRFNVTDRNYYIKFEPKRDAIKNTNFSEDEFGEYIIDEFAARWGNDVALLGLNAGYSGSTAVTIPAELQGSWQGWLARAEGDADSDRIGLENTTDAETDSMPVYDHSDGGGTPQPVDTEMFNASIQTLAGRYTDPDDVVFLLASDNVQQYQFDLTGREDGVGVAVLQGDSDVTPFDYDVVPVNGMPRDVGLFTSFDNLAYGLYGEMELDQTTDTETIHEDRLHSQNWLEGQFDYQIKEMQAGVLIEGIQDPNA
jgi:hypothetical protein